MAFGAALLVGNLNRSSTFAHAQTSQVILREDFEGEFKADSLCREGKCEVPAGWSVWFIPRKEEDPPGVNFQPSFEQWRDKPYSGNACQRVWVSKATFNGGLYRVVTGIQPGAQLRLSAWVRVRSTNDDSPISTRPSRDIRVRIGLDPLGGEGSASPLSGQVVQSPEKSTTDEWVQLTVEAQARASTVIIYTYATMRDPVRHNEVFWDEIVLESVTPPTPTPEPTATAANTEPVLPAPTPTPAPLRADVTYTVKAGDTLSGIALEYNVTVEDLLRNNPGVRPEALQIGQVLVVKRAELQPTPTPEPAQSAAAPTQLDPFATPTTGQICVQAFLDDDGNGRREEGEDLVPNIIFVLSSNGRRIAEYTTAGVEEPYCFENLANGTYVVSATALDLYNVTTPLDDTIAVAGARAYFSVGLRRKQDGFQNVGRAAAADLSPPVNWSAVLSIGGGTLLFIGALGVGAFVLLRQRRL
ncbi:MAG: LysM peptidoglycan-binding domain-containing protein [Thermoflexales bacterium]|nr:LysM peptidoglycan-binding domain-containing protein [Thermoflexales bacterium]